MPWRLTSHGTIVSSRDSRAVAVSWVNPAISALPRAPRARPAAGGRPSRRARAAPRRRRRRRSRRAPRRSPRGRCSRGRRGPTCRRPRRPCGRAGAGCARRRWRTRSTAGLGWVGGCATRCTISSGSWSSGTSKDPARPAVRTRPDDARQAEGPRRAAVDVEGVEVPAAVPRHERPGLHVPLAGLGGLGAPVGEAQRHPAQHAVLDARRRPARWCAAAARCR